MDRHIYLAMKDNITTKDEFDNYFPDIMTFSINRFKYSESPEEIVISEYYLNRLDLLMWDYYGLVYYDDIILWLNNIDYKENITAGDKLLLPSKEDLENFFLTYSV